MDTEEEYVLLDPTNPEVNNFAVLNSSLPEQHHLSSYVSAKRSASDFGAKRRSRPGDPHRTKWHFGVRSRSPPMEIVLEIYKTLKVLDMEWVEKKSLGELGGVKTRLVRDDNGMSKIERVKKLDGQGDVDLRLASSIYLIEARSRVQDVVVCGDLFVSRFSSLHLHLFQVYMNLQLYCVDATNYLVDFHHKKSYRASTEPGAGKFDVAVSTEGKASKEAEVVSPYIFMDVACRLILELAGGT